MDAERARFDRLAGGEEPEVGARRALLQAAAHEAEREPAAVDGSGRGLQREAQAADVVLMPWVRTIARSRSRRSARYWKSGTIESTPRHLRAREHDSGVDQKKMIPPLDH